MAALKYVQVMQRKGRGRENKGDILIGINSGGKPSLTNKTAKSSRNRAQCQLQGIISLFVVANVLTDLEPCGIVSHLSVRQEILPACTSQFSQSPISPLTVPLPCHNREFYR